MMYRCQLKQGSRTYIERFEFRSMSDCQAFYSKLVTSRLTEAYGHSVYKDTGFVPVDDFNYKTLVKMIVRSKTSAKSVQLSLRNVKLNKNKEEIFTALKEHCTIDGEQIGSIVNYIEKRSQRD